MPNINIPELEITGTYQKSKTPTQIATGKSSNAADMFEVVLTNKAGTETKYFPVKDKITGKWSKNPGENAQLMDKVRAAIDSEEGSSNS